MLRAAVDEAGLADDVEVTSAGTSTEEIGNPMDRRTVTALREHGVPDLGWADHRARRFDPAWLDEADLILPTDHVHDEILRREAADNPTYLDKIRMIRSFDPEAVEAGDLGMADPWYGNGTHFDLTYSQIEGALPGLVEHLRAKTAHSRG